MAANDIQLGLIQTHADVEPSENLARQVGLIERAADAGAQVVCLQELFRTRYFPQTEDDANFELAESIPGATTDRLAQVAREREIVLIASLFEKRAPGLFHNTAVVIDADGSILGRYRKMHIPDDPRFYEKYYFAPGDLGFRAFDTRVGRIGVLICWDQWYPEAARLTALHGAWMLFYPTAIGTASEELALTAQQHDAWQTVQRSHAISNGVYVAAANRVGVEDEIHFWGRSFVTAPSGAVIAEAGTGEEILLSACDPTAVDRAREGWPFLRDRRIDAYGPLTQRYLGAE